MFLTEKEVQEAKDQIEKLKTLVRSLYHIDASGKYCLKEGINKSHLQHAEKAIYKVMAIYSERMESLDVLNKDIDEQEDDVAKTRNLMGQMNKKYGGNIYPKWLMKTFGVE